PRRRESRRASAPPLDPRLRGDDRLANLRWDTDHHGLNGFARIRATHLRARPGPAVKARTGAPIAASSNLCRVVPDFDNEVGRKWRIAWGEGDLALFVGQAPSLPG